MTLDDEILPSSSSSLRWLCTNEDVEAKTPARLDKKSEQNVKTPIFISCFASYVRHTETSLTKDLTRELSSASISAPHVHVYVQYGRRSPPSRPRGPE